MYVNYAAIICNLICACYVIVLIVVLNIRHRIDSEFEILIM
jgi:hypothetical protein